MDELAREVEVKRSRLAWLLGHVTLDLRPLRDSREFRLLFIGQFVSAFGSAITYVVIPWQMWQLTHSSAMVGLIGVAEFVPMLGTALFAGALADAMDRRRLLLWAESVLVVAVCALMVNAELPRPSVPVLFVAAAIAATANALHRPAHEALSPRLVDAAHLPALSSLSTFRYSFNAIVGPALGGLIAQRLGAGAAYAIDLATYGVAICTLLQLKPVAIAKQAEPLSLRSAASGLAYAWSRQELIGTYVIDIVAMFFGMPIALFPALAESLHAEVGLFYSSLAVGPLIITLTSGWTQRVKRHGLAVILSVVVWGLAIALFGVSRELWLSLLMLGLAGASDCVSGLFRMTMWNETIPDHMRGRLASIEMVSYTTGPYLGNAEAGLVAAAFGLRASVVSGGAFCVLGAALVALWLPKFRRYDAARRAPA